MPIALVTGASQGIGAAIAKRLARDGAPLALLARNQEKLRQVQQQIAAGGGKSIVVVCDVTQPDSVTAAIAQVRTELGEPLILINNAGVGGPFHLTTEVTDAEWEQLFATNVRSAFLFTRALLPAMQAAGFGRIVNIASIYGLRGGARSSTYAATKHALVGYTRSIAAEWGPHGITCNAVCPGLIATEAIADSVEHARLAEGIPTGRFGRPEEVADLVAQLVRPEASFWNGAEVVLDGGQIAGLR